MKITKILVLSLAVMSMAFFAYAQDTEVKPENEFRTEVRQIRDEVKEFIGTEREDVREDIQERRETFIEETSILRAEANTDELREELRMKRDSFREDIRLVRDELRTRIESKRSELKDRLLEIRDERKREVVERIDSKMDALNERMTNHYMNVLDKIEDALTRVSDRAGASVLDGAISDAQSAIDTARAAVQEQAGKTYSFDISDEEDLRVDVGRARQALGDDLAAVRDLVKKAKEAVRNAAVTLAQLNGSELEPTETPESDDDDDDDEE